MSTHGESGPKRWRFTVAFAGFVAVAAFFLVSEHRAHLLGALPYVLLLLCPLLHLFGHGRHGARGGAPRRGDGHEH